MNPLIYINAVHQAKAVSTKLSMPKLTIDYNYPNKRKKSKEQNVEFKEAEEWGLNSDIFFLISLVPWLKLKPKIQEN